VLEFPVEGGGGRHGAVAAVAGARRGVGERPRCRANVCQTTHDDDIR